MKKTMFAFLSTIALVTACASSWFNPGSSAVTIPFSNAVSGAFDGSSTYVEVANNASNDPEYTSAFSFTGWFKTTSGTMVVSTRNTGAAGYEFFLEPDPVCWIRNQANNAVLSVVPGGAGFSDGAFHHFACVNDGLAQSTSLKMYIDGALYATSSSVNASGTAVSGNALRFGYRNSATPFWLSGSLSHIALYNKGLSGAEVSTIYNSGVPTNLSLLSTWANNIGWWEFQTGISPADTTSLVKDRSPGGHDAAAFNLTYH